ncbi:MAG: glucose/sorbosone dehydrogenase [Phycisphaerales bacterium]|nr:glucose/sorbosone dehydrogenase [Phycisphaerales bacterium]
MIEPLEPRTLLTGFSETAVATGLHGPTAMAFAPDGRLFITEQSGALRIVKNNALLAAPFVSLRVDSGGERGLLGVALDPNFASNHFIYVYYTVPGRRHTPAHNRVSRFTDNGDVALKRSEQILLDITPLSAATNHNGGAIHFGPDGKLYIATGENNNGANAQDITNLLGKILRINADGTIPTDNPFYANASGSNKAIWAIGLRNPFNFSFNSATGQMLINDVGEHTYEEINVGVAGANYGWPATEGPTHRRRFRAPICYYAHGDTLTTGQAIVGSAFYSPGGGGGGGGRTFPRNYAGDYFFADLTSGWIRRLDPVSGDVAAFASGITVPVALAVGDADGALYYLARGAGEATGAVGRIQYTANGAI